MNKYVRISVLVGLASTSLILAETTEFRTPQRLTRGEMHWPLKPIEKTWWYDQMDTEECENKNHWVDVWAGYYGITASEAFFKPNGGITTQTSSLSALWFGTDTFVGQDILAIVPEPGTLMSSNPFLGFARITPQFSYDEKGVVFGLRTMHTFGCDDMWHSGIRLSLPVKDITIEQCDGAQIEESLGNVVQERYTNEDASADPTQIDFAYRLDFLTSLGIPVTTPTPGFDPMVQYGDGTGSPLTNTQIAGQSMTGPTGADTAAGMCMGPEGLNCFPGAYVIRANGNNPATVACCCPSQTLIGNMPEPPFYRFDTQVVGYVAADGSGGGNGSALYFKLNGQDYATGLQLDTAAQSQLFVVARAVPVPGPGETFELTVNSQTIVQQVTTLLNLIEDSSASLFFAQNGIDLYACPHVVGVGDLTLEWYVGYGDRYDYYIDGVIGAIFPTGTNPGSSQEIYLKPTGNNRHYELKLGLEGGYNWCDLFAIRGEAFYSHAFKKSEDRAAVFTTSPDVTTNTNCGCTINTEGTLNCIYQLKNIGSPICVDVSWNTFYGRLDFTVFHPYNDELGMTFGYEFYYKSHDDIGIDCGECNNQTVMATDLLGNTGTVDFCAMAYNSQVFSNKVYAEIFHRWNFFELFAGASQIVAGENVMKESEAHLGLRLYF